MKPRAGSWQARVPWPTVWTEPQSADYRKYTQWRNLNGLRIQVIGVTWGSWGFGIMRQRDMGPERKPEVPA